MRELLLTVTIKGPDGVAVGAIKYDERAQVFERQQDGSYVVRFVKDPEHEYLIPVGNVRVEKRIRAKK